MPNRPLTSLVKRGLGALGLELRRVRRDAVTPEEEALAKYEYYAEARPLLRRVAPYTMVPAQNLATLYEQVRYVEARGLPGALVECGVWKGGSVGLMALANLRHGTRRRDVHLFDAFDDIPEPNPAVDGERAVAAVHRLLGREDVELTGARRSIPGLYDSYGGHGEVDAVRHLLTEDIGYPADRLHFHVGYFEEVVPAAAPTLGKIAVPRLDGDWYSSTKVCLEHLVERVVPGGLIIVDDYGAYDGCRRAVREFLDGRPDAPPFLAYSDPHCRYWQRPG